MANRNVIDKESGHILPPDDGEEWKPREVQGSFYLTMLKAAQDHMDQGGDWKWLENVITGDKLNVKEAFELGKK